jgi:hypothetical protein
MYCCIENILHTLSRYRNILLVVLFTEDIKFTWFEFNDGFPLQHYITL